MVTATHTQRMGIYLSLHMHLHHHRCLAESVGNISNVMCEQESIPVGCVPPACPWQRPPGQRPPPRGQGSPRQRPPWTDAPWKEHGTRQPDRRWHHTKTPPPPEDRQTCRNITLPQTSFAGGSRALRLVERLVLFIPCERQTKTCRTERNASNLFSKGLISHRQQQQQKENIPDGNCL